MIVADIGSGQFLWQRKSRLFLFDHQGSDAAHRLFVIISRSPVAPRRRETRHDLERTGVQEQAYISNHRRPRRFTIIPFPDDEYDPLFDDCLSGYVRSDHCLNIHLKPDVRLRHLIDVR